jgi:hypothetical protein
MLSSFDHEGISPQRNISRCFVSSCTTVTTFCVGATLKRGPVCTEGATPNAFATASMFTVNVKRPHMVFSSFVVRLSIAILF